MELIQNINLSIKFFLEGYPKQVRESYVIYAQLILNRKKALLATKINVSPDEWDFANQQFLPTKQFNLVRNNKLREIREKFILIYFELSKRNLPLSVKQIVRNYKGELMIGDQTRLIDYFDQHIIELKKQKSNYAPGTIKSYQRTRSHLQRFLAKSGWTEMKISEVNRKFIERFENFLITEPTETTKIYLHLNTVNTYLRKLKASIKVAIRKEIITADPFVGFKMKPIKPTKKEVLTMEEVEVLKIHDLGQNKSLIRVRDLYLFALYTGLRYSDVNSLRKEMFTVDKNGMYWISLNQQKTDEPIEIPLVDEAVKIYNRYEDYRNTSKNEVFPPISNQKVNSYLKVVGELVGITKRLNFHSARHSFAVLSLEQGVEIKSVSALMGHTSIRSTEIYGYISRTRKADVVKYLNKKNMAAQEENNTRVIPDLSSISQN